MRHGAGPAADAAETARGTDEARRARAAAAASTRASRMERCIQLSHLGTCLRGMGGGRPKLRPMLPAVKGTPAMIAERIREEIAAGTLPPGSALNQVELAARFGVSRIPVREALRALEADGTVSYATNRGAVVAALNPCDVRERFEMRLVLEPLALEHAIPALTGDHLRRAKYELDAMRAEREPRTWGLHHGAFHRVLYEAAQRPKLAATIESLYLSVMRDVTPAAVREQMRMHDAEHRAIYAACRARDVAAATRALREHLERSCARALGGMPVPDEEV